MSETNKQAKSLDDGKELLPDDDRSEQKYVLGTRAERFRLRLADDSVWQADDSVWQTLLGRTPSLLSVQYSGSAVAAAADSSSRRNHQKAKQSTVLNISGSLT